MQRPELTNAILVLHLDFVDSHRLYSVPTLSPPHTHHLTLITTIITLTTSHSSGEGPAPEKCVPMALAAGLRYGENPHQPAAFYTDQSLREHDKGGVATSVQHNGKEMSYNNYLDANAAYAAVCDFAAPTCVIVKHTNPCGVASGDDLLKSYRLAVEADPVSAFGGIVAFNRPVDADLAREIREFRSPTDGETRMFYEIVIAPGYTPEGLEVLKGKSKTLRILEAKARGPSGVELRQILGTLGHSLLRALIGWGIC